MEEKGRALLPYYFYKQWESHTDTNIWSVVRGQDQMDSGPISQPQGYADFTPNLTDSVCLSLLAYHVLAHCSVYKYVVMRLRKSTRSKYILL
jgi:hypothetical protein